jgi:hypothetical protein
MGSLKNTDGITCMTNQYRHYLVFFLMLSQINILNGQCLTEIQENRKYISDENISYVLIFRGSPQADSITDYILAGGNSDSEGDLYGYSISSAGDFNHDGYDDFLISAVYYSTEIDYVGAAYLYLGTGEDTFTPGLTIVGDEFFGYLGLSVANAGDINGDNYSDILIGGFFGEVLLILGSNNPSASQIIAFKENQASQYFGGCVSSVGDINRDGFDDFIIGDGTNESNGYYSGRAYVYLGGPIIDTLPDFILDGETEYSLFGETVTCAGDANGDDYSDIIIGAPGYKIGDHEVGRVYLYLGSSDFDTIPDWVITGDSLRPMGIGNNIDKAGDINHDGYDDIIIGIPFTETEESTHSYVDIYFGGESIDTVADITLTGGINFGGGSKWGGDFNGDGIDDFMMYNNQTVNLYYGGIEPDTIPDIIFVGIRDQWNSQWFRSNACIGDINNDGYTDIAIGISSLPPSDLSIDMKGQNSLPEMHILPNPVIEEAYIEYQLTIPSQVEIKVFSQTGEEISILTKGYQLPGKKCFIWHPENIRPGVYFMRLSTKNSSQTHGFVYLKNEK